MKKFYLTVFIFLLFFGARVVWASETSGAIDDTDKYAWGENIGWVNFGCDGCSVNITDNNISGYAWSKEFGWINLSPSQGGNIGVRNTSGGVLSGYAWSKNLGWINFTGVFINLDGEFQGYATIKTGGSRISFNCANEDSCGSADFKVKTDWRPADARHHYHGPVLASLSSSSVAIPETPAVSVAPPAPATPIANAIENILNFFQPKKKPTETIIVQVSKIAPPSFNSRWNLLPVKAIREFVFAPLPYEVRILASKFPELGNTLKNVGVERMTDMNKLTSVALNIPGLAEELNKTLKTVGVKELNEINKLSGVALDIPGLSNMDQKMATNLGLGKIALIKGLPLAKFPLSAKKNLPAEFVFARAGGELVDLNVIMSIGDKGEVSQKISSLPGEKIRLVVKPVGPARSVTGYFVFKSATPRISENQISRASLTASALFSMNGLVEKAPELIPVEKKLVLSSFIYADPDHDGIYTADVVTPAVPGEYEIVTVIDYIDPILGVRRMSLITVIDPEGYVYEKNNGKETRIPSAIVSLYYLNTATKKYELWPAKEYQQENPQITDIRGTYSFLVPEGSYYFEVEAPGYDSYNGKAFAVAEGNSIHQNIELTSGRGWLSLFDWRTTLLIVVFLLLVYNLFRNSLHNELSKFFKKS